MNWWSVLWGIWALIVLSDLRTIIRNQGVINTNQGRILKKLQSLESSMMGNEK